MMKYKQTPTHNNTLCSSILPSHILKIKVTLLIKGIPSRDIPNKVIPSKAIHNNIHLTQPTSTLLDI
ncbi:hypothetical protein OESDEN_06315 [Oesophagostomum dentatum]|uniref:Uncharacterized protein n=1 Tax=Oesophagostomum dentatum TaxID=61180 RepID=A0A0B1TCD3_OESDE|nr:hypothetical protein OESDEN_06315 [Oesophagostomum dentatum]